MTLFVLLSRIILRGTPSSWYRDLDVTMGHFAYLKLNPGQNVINFFFLPEQSQSYIYTSHLGATHYFYCCLPSIFYLLFTTSKSQIFYKDLDIINICSKSNIHPRTDILHYGFSDNPCHGCSRGAEKRIFGIRTRKLLHPITTILRPSLTRKSRAVSSRSLPYRQPRLPPRSTNSRPLPPSLDGKLRTSLGSGR